MCAARGTSSFSHPSLAAERELISRLRRNRWGDSRLQRILIQSFGGESRRVTAQGQSYANCQPKDERGRA